MALDIRLVGDRQAGRQRCTRFGGQRFVRPAAFEQWVLVRLENIRSGSMRPG
jgi:hypothetical protein